jgi:epoxyqueuosine reductase
MAAIIRRIMSKIGSTNITANEDRIRELDGVTIANPDAPVRALFGGPGSDDHKKFPVSGETLLDTMTVMRGTFSGLRQTFKDLDENPDEPLRLVEDGFLKDFEEYARSLGIASIGYAKLPVEYIFKDKAVLFRDAIVLSMEMDREKMSMAPSAETQKMVLETYRDLGYVTNKLAGYLREKGYSVQASHPLGGPALYLPLGELAGMGYHGRHGLLITPELGPRHRLSAIYTSIENLPYTDVNEHEWIADFCRTCGRCIQTCPGKAIREEPVHNSNGTITHIDNTKCFPEFSGNYGCSVCIKECLFNTGSYEENKSGFKCHIQ